MRQETGRARIYWDDLEADADRAPFVLFARCRIDNRRELLDQLALPQATDDGALLVALYRQHGKDCADQILGDFAFAICDPDRSEVFLARDFLGLQPLYYSRNSKGLFVADSIERLLEYGDVSDEEDLPFISAKLSYGFAHYRRTSFAEVRKPTPGHVLIVGRRNSCEKPYWDPRQIKQRSWPSHEDCLAEFRALVQQAIIDRLPDSGRVGIHVSGGLDCSAIAILTAQELRNRKVPAPIAYTWYPPPSEDLSQTDAEEYERLDAAARAMDAEPVYTRPSAENVLATLARDSRKHPLCNASYNERPVLEDAKRQGVSVILSGFGGDEAASFDGRGYTHELAVTGQWRKLSAFAKAESRNWFGYCVNQLAIGLLHRFLPSQRLDQFNRSLVGRGHSRLKILWRLFAPIKPDVPSNDRASTYMRPEFAASVEPLPQIGAVRYTTSRHARCNLLRWPALVTRWESWDAHGAEFGVKYAYPLLDRRVVEFALALPSEVFRSPKWKRLFFREAMDPVLPAEICWRHVKSDPARIAPLLEAFDRAFERIAAQIKDDRYSGEKAAKLDCDALVEDIAMSGFKPGKNLAALLSAIEYLGSKSDRT